MAVPKDLLALVGNPDAYAVQHEDGSWTPVREPLLPKVIRAHMAGEITVGTYIVNPPNTARTLVFDIDAADAVERHAQVSAVLAVLDDLGLSDYVALEDSGRKGYHVWVVAERFMEAETLYRLGRGVRDEAGLPKLEVFPKQREVRDLGNLVKLPEGIHRVTGKPNPFMAGPPVPIPVATLETLALQYPEANVRKSGGVQSIEYPCVHSIQEGVAEGGRNNHLFHLAVMLRKFSLNDENVETAVRRANDRSPDGPLDDFEVEQLLESSRNSGPICGSLDDSVNCGDQCIMAKHDGLYTRAGALRYANNGERVVVEVASRTEDGKVLELMHPDMEQGRAVVARPVRKRETNE